MDGFGFGNLQQRAARLTQGERGGRGGRGRDAKKLFLKLRVKRSARFGHAPCENRTTTRTKTDSGSCRVTTSRRYVRPAFRRSFRCGHPSSSSISDRETTKTKGGRRPSMTGVRERMSGFLRQKRGGFEQVVLTDLPLLTFPSFLCPAISVALALPACLLIFERCQQGAKVRTAHQVGI